MSSFWWIFVRMYLEKESKPLMFLVVSQNTDFDRDLLPNEGCAPHRLLGLLQSQSRAHFMNDFSIVIQIRWAIGLCVTPLQAIISLQKFAHATTAQLSYHEQNFIAITSYKLDESIMKFPSNLNYDGKIVHEMGLRVLLKCRYMGHPVLIVDMGDSLPSLNNFILFSEQVFQSSRY